MGSYRMIGKEILNENDLAPQLVHGIKYVLKDDEQNIDKYNSYLYFLSE